MKRKIKLIFWAMISAMVLFAVFVVSRSCHYGENEAKQNTLDTTEVLVQQIRLCSRLYTAEVSVRKIITHNDKAMLSTSIMSKKFDFELPIGKRSIAIPLHATIKAYIDLNNFSADNVAVHGDRIEVFLPDPKLVLTQSKIQNEEIKQYVPLLRSNFTDEELTNYNAQGRENIISSIPKLNIMNMAQEGAANVLIPLFEQMGYKEENITITFRKEFTIDDIKRMVVAD